MSGLGTPTDPRLWPDGSREELPSLAAGDVHLWSADLDALDPTGLRLPLDAAEHSRAAAFRFARDAHRFRVAMWMRRSILGRYLGKEPADLRFCTGPYGRPELDLSDFRCRLRFNASHSGGVTILALTLDNPIGVDIEIPRPLPDLFQMAHATFHPSEWHAIIAMGDPADREAAFYRCWTRKEAIAKGVGLGLNLPFDRFSVETTPIKTPAVTSIEPGLDLESSWHLRDLSGTRVYAAVATSCAPRRLACRSWLP
ncbi:MAG: hypothetical protein K0S56_2919 [Microvirga sp.]|jgi:4'-phosphopantetheinyl transferase|nr:hypothetical protein [Microvirga sp.]